jgi:integrase/recombinase XerC
MIQWDLFEDLKSWIKSLKEQQNYSERTIDAYWGDVHTCLKFLASRTDLPLTREVFQQRTTQDFKVWLDYRKEKGYGVRSTVRAFSIMRQFCKFLVAQKILNADPLSKLKAPSVVLREPIQKKCFVLRNKIIYHLFNEEGLSVTEILALNKGDVLISPPMLSILNKKNKKRFLPISDEILNHIQLYLTFLPFPFTPDTPLFVGPRGKRLTPSVVRSLATSETPSEEAYQKCS